MMNPMSRHTDTNLNSVLPFMLAAVAPSMTMPELRYDRRGKRRSISEEERDRRRKAAKKAKANRKRNH